MNKFEKITIAIFAIILSLALYMGVNKAMSQEGITCLKPTTLDKLVEESTKIGGGEAPEIYTPDEFHKMINWYEGKYRKLDKPFPYDGIKHFLVQKLNKNIIVNNRIFPAGHYFGILLYENGCIHGWPIAKTVYDKYMKETRGEEAHNNG